MATGASRPPPRPAPATRPPADTAIVGSGSQELLERTVCRPSGTCGVWGRLSVHNASHIALHFHSSPQPSSWFPEAARPSVPCDVMRRGAFFSGRKFPNGASLPGTFAPGTLMESESQEVVLPLRKRDGRKPFGSGAVFKAPGLHRPRRSCHLAFQTEKKSLYHPKGGRLLSSQPSRSGPPSPAFNVFRSDGRSFQPVPGGRVGEKEWGRSKLKINNGT